MGGSENKCADQSGAVVDDRPKWRLLGAGFGSAIIGRCRMAIEMHIAL